MVSAGFEGTNVVNLGRTEAGIRSPRPGAAAPQWGDRLDHVYRITRLVALADGRILFSSTGRRTERRFPEFDAASVTTLLNLPTGHWIVAGRFSRVSGVPRFRMARLTSDFVLDPGIDASASFEPWQVVDVLALDAQGRLLAAGAGVSFDGSLTNPAPYGLVRLLSDGTTDPEFTRAPGWGRSLFVESDGSLVTGLPLQRWSSDGGLVASFPGNPSAGSLGFEPDHRLVRLPDGSFVAPGGLDGIELQRWLPDGRVDDLFENAFRAHEFLANRRERRVRRASMAVLSAGSPLRQSIRRGIRRLPGPGQLLDVGQVVHSAASPLVGQKVFPADEVHRLAVHRGGHPSGKGASKISAGDSRKNLDEVRHRSESGDIFPVKEPL